MILKLILILWTNKKYCSKAVGNMALPAIFKKHYDWKLAIQLLKKNIFFSP